MDYNAIPFVLQAAPKLPTPLHLIGGVQTPETVTPPQFHPYSILEKAFFDWYQCALSVDPQEVVSAAERFFRDESDMVVRMRHITPQRPYKTAVELYSVSPSHEVVFCSVHFGGVNEKCMFRATSDRATRGAEFVRSRFPDHTCSRVDVAMDFCEGPELFGVLVDWLVEYANNCNPKMAVDYRGDWSNASKGRTLYVGSRKSATYIRLYEKGFQQIAVGNPDADPDWVRFEAEIKPEKKEGKAKLARATPEQCFGCSRLLRDFVEFISGDKLEPITVGKVRKMTDHDRTFSHMCYQYGSVLMDQLEMCEDADEFVLSIIEKILSQKELKARSRERLASIKENFVPSGLTAKARSIPSAPPAREASRLSPALLRRYPSLLRHQSYQAVPVAHRMLEWPALSAP